MRPAAAALAVAALLVLAAEPSAAAKRAVPRGFYGVAWSGELKTKSSVDLRIKQWRRMARTGVESVRTTFEWGNIQRTSDGLPDWSSPDRIVRLSARFGINLLPVVIAAPSWAAGTANSHHFRPRDPADYGRFMQLLVARYGPHGSFWAANSELPRRPIRSWQIWNEPALPFYWPVRDGEDWAEGYGQLLRTAYSYTKAADPRARVVLAGFANDSWNALRHLYERGDVKDSFDVAAVHPYSAQDGGVVEIVRRFRHVMANHGDAKLPLWVTEFGLPASKGRAQNPSLLQTTPQGMRRFLRRTAAQLEAARSKASTAVGRTFWFTWGSSYTGNSIWHYAGLVRWRPGGGAPTEQPALHAYRSVALEAAGR